MTLNKVQLIGRVGQDPDFRTTQAGATVANLRLATDEFGGGEKRTEWHSVVLFGKSAELAQKYVTKGKLLYVEGRLQTRSWEDATGNKRHTTEIVGQEMRFLGSPSAQASAGSATSAAGGAGGVGHVTFSAAPADRAVANGFEDEVPF